MWLYGKGVMVPEEKSNPVDVELESFFDCCQTGKRPLADLEVGLHDSTAVMAQDRISPVTVPVFVGSQLVGTPTDPEGAWTVSADGKSFVFTPKAGTGLTGLPGLTGVTKRVLYRIGGNAKMAAIVVLLPAAPLTADASRVNPQPVTVFDPAKESGVQVTLLDPKGQPAKSVLQTELTWSPLEANQVAFSITALPPAPTSVSVPYALTYGGKTSLPSQVTLTFTASGTVPTAVNANCVTADRTNSVTFILEGAALLQGTLTDAGGARSANGTQATYTPSTLPATQFSTSVKYVYTAGTTPATLSITFLPAPQAIPRTGVIRTVITSVDAQAANGVTAGTVKLWDGTAAVTSLPDTPSGGEWGLSVDGKSITFTPTLGLPLRAASVSTAYALAGSDGPSGGPSGGTVSAVPGTITLTFSSAPVAYDIPSPKNANRFTRISIPFLDHCVIPDGYQSVIAQVKPGELGKWNVLTDNQGNPIITVDGDNAVGNVATLQYSVVDKKGVTSNTATITIDYTAMQRFMPMAGDCSISTVPAPGQSVAAQVLAGSSSFYAKDPTSVKLLAFTDIGQGNPIPNGLLGKDGKSLHAPGQGTWLVDLNGAVVFQADPTLSAPVTPTPVSFQFADLQGNLSNPGVVVIDATTTEPDQLPTQLAALDDTAFWAAYQRHVSRPQPYLPSEDFVAITAILAGATLVCGAGGRNPVAPADFDAGYQAWNDAGQSWDDPPGTAQPSGLVAICAKLVNAALPVNQALPANQTCPMPP